MEDERDIIIWATAGEIAARDGISAEAVLKAVRKMIEQHDLVVERDARGRIKRFDLAAFDLYRERYANPAQTLARRPARPGKPISAAGDNEGYSYDEGRRQAQWLEVRKKRIELAEFEGRLIRADKLAEALEVIGREALVALQRLPNKADDLAEAVAREGVSGLRVRLRNEAAAVATALADRLAELAEHAPRYDPSSLDGEK